MNYISAGTEKRIVGYTVSLGQPKYTVGDKGLTRPDHQTLSKYEHSQRIKYC